MYKSPSFFAVSLMALVSVAGYLPADGHKFNIGTPASAEEIAGWDIDIRPDGKGLPVGSGNALNGEATYETYCASCHGVFGEGEGRWPVLAGGEGSLTDARPIKTVGSYWPYSSTLFDYIRRAMPFTAPLSLSDQQVYDVTAYVLYLNELVEEDFELTHENLATIKMPNEANFFIDDRPDADNTRCMKNCENAESLMLISSLSGITPVGHVVEGADSPAASHEEQHKLEAEKEAQRISLITGKPIEAKKETATSPALSQQAMQGEPVYTSACIACHGSGVAGAPKVGDVSPWVERINQGQDILIKHALEGYIGDNGVMPAKGGRMDLSDEQVINSVYYMIEMSQ